MNCEDKKIPFWFWDFIKKIPVLRYLKAPVFDVHQLYERYQDGLEAGCYVFVINKFTFYGWDFKKKEWKKIGYTEEDIQKLLGSYITDAPKDGKTYARQNGKWVEVKSCECDMNPSAEIVVDPLVINFTPEADTKNVSVAITGTSNEAFTITGAPSWLSVSGQTTSGFTLSVGQNPTENDRDAVITVTSNENPLLSKTISIVQYGAWLSDFIFDVNIPSDNFTPDRIVNIGSVLSGDAQFDWGDGTPIEIMNVPQSYIEFADDLANGGKMPIVHGTDFTHSYELAGTYTVTIKTRNGVDLFKFSKVPLNAGNQWYSTTLANDVVTQIRKIQSDYITNGRRMFAGVRFGWFDPLFVFECPNVNNFDYFMEVFGSEGVELYSYLPTHRLRLPENFYSLIQNKHLITTATRTYWGSGFEAIERCMLSFSTGLTSTYETFSRMMNVGLNWNVKYPSQAFNNWQFPEFVSTDIFQDNPNIQNFTGCFDFINDFYGTYPDTGYNYWWMLKKEMFENNVAIDINISRMFKQCNRAILEVGFLDHIMDRVKRMDFTFYYGFNYGGNPQIASDKWLWGWMTEYYDGKDYRGASDLNLLFPEAEYPVLESAVGCFGWAFNEGGTDGNVSGKRGIRNGLQFIFRANQVFNTQLNITDWELFTAQLKLGQSDGFLAKFPNCTETSGFNHTTGLQDGSTDSWANNFWDFDTEDTSNQKKISDFYTVKAIRPQIFEELDLIN